MFYAGDVADLRTLVGRIPSRRWGERLRLENCIW
jgi:hypothetical protein